MPYEVKFDEVHLPCVNVLKNIGLHEYSEFRPEREWFRMDKNKVYLCLACLFRLMDLRMRYTHVFSTLVSAHGFKSEVYLCLARLLLGETRSFRLHIALEVAASSFAYSGVFLLSLCVYKLMLDG